MSPKLIAVLESFLPAAIQNIKQVGGGDINEARQLDTAKGSFFVKLNNHSVALDMFEQEAKGLALLATTSSFKIPETLAVGQVDETSYLLLEHINSGLRTTSFWENFGTQLAEMHRQAQAYFGLDHDNYIGTLTQANTPHDTWTSFYPAQRLAPQLKMAIDQNRMTLQDAKAFDRLYKRLPEICPEETAALLHGDLWSGNFMSASPSNPVLIDPAVSFGHREMDIAMTRLFGGFDAAFYEAYHNAYPLQKGFDSRIDIYQLYYLLVHVNLFGGGYVNSVRKTLSRF